MLRLNDLLRSRVRASGEAGFTLVELIVAMGIFSIFIAIFMTAVANLGRGTTRAQLTAEASSGLLQVFQTLDRQVRYADTINVAGAGTSGARYIEFRTNEPTATGVDVAMCTQWRFVPSQSRIETRRWKETDLSTTTPWTTKLTAVVDQGGAGYPFTMVPATLTTSRQQLRLTVQAGNEEMDAGAEASTTFVARNSSMTSVSNAGPASGVCQRTGLRP